jgi:hypothetical protein
MITSARILTAAFAILSIAWPATADLMCPGDLNGDNEVRVDELITIVNYALEGCPGPQPTVTPGGPRFVDNGNRTVTDHVLGLMWETKSDDGSIHDKDNRYQWTRFFQGTAPDGEVFTVFLAGLNADAFAGHHDWRLPTLEELSSLIDTDHSAPPIDPVFHRDCAATCSSEDCSCTAFCAVPPGPGDPSDPACAAYWTSSEWSPTGAYVVTFNANGAAAGVIKEERHAARAVRNLP